MYVRRSVCGVVCGSGGRPCAVSRAEAASQAVPEGCVNAARTSTRVAGDCGRSVVEQMSNGRPPALGVAGDRPYSLTSQRIASLRPLTCRGQGRLCGRAGGVVGASACLTHNHGGRAAYEARPAGQLEIVRPKRGTLDLFRAYHVVIDEHDVGEVRRGESRVFWTPPGRHEVHLVIDWCRSPSVDVDVALGETVRLLCWPKFQFWTAKRGLANPDEWLVLEHDVSASASRARDRPRRHASGNAAEAK
jgi:hypothetical protein